MAFDQILVHLFLLFVLNLTNKILFKPNITQLFICKGEKTANAGYLENIADYCESYNLYLVEWVCLIAPGHPRILQDTQVTPRYIRTHLYFYIIHLFIHSDENKAKMPSNLHFKFKKVLLNSADAG